MGGALQLNSPAFSDGSRLYTVLVSNFKSQMSRNSALSLAYTLGQTWHRSYALAANKIPINQSIQPRRHSSGRSAATGLALFALRILPPLLSTGQRQNRARIAVPCPW